MFTGIITSLGQIIARDGGYFVVKHAFGDLLIGQSIAHDGACMTLTEVGSDFYTFFAIAETLEKANFGDKKIGDYFNIERPLKIGDQLDGHMVTGHIDTTARVLDRAVRSDGSHILRIELSEDSSNLVIPKGSITINGVSLTVVDASKASFTVHIIPHTWDVTNLGRLQVGDRVNLEFDMIGKYALRLFQNHSPLSKHSLH